MKHCICLSLFFALCFSQLLLATEPVERTVKKEDTVNQPTTKIWNLVYEKKIACWSDNCRTVLGINVCDYYGKFHRRYQKTTKGEILEKTVFDVRKLGTSAFDMCN